MNEEQLERERHIDDDYTLVNHYYKAKRMHPNLPFYLNDGRETFEFGWTLIYQYIARLSEDGTEGLVEFY